MSACCIPKQTTYLAQNSYFTCISLSYMHSDHLFNLTGS
uniref:Uncharacterized protein n=1 Tax=Anguilla anguilla TaxID=7936 RepID=A0A0E9WKU7_ANGAN